MAFVVAYTAVMLQDIEKNSASLLRLRWRLIRNPSPKSVDLGVLDHLRLVPSKVNE